MRLAYADPPYIGQAAKHYRHDPQCAEVDHVELIARLERDYDGWALSASEPSLWDILPVCPRVRIGAWVKPFCSFKPNVRVAYAWEPVIFRPARGADRARNTARNWVSANITLRKGLSGAKPVAFCYWLFDVLGADPRKDTLDDIFPGTGIVMACWNALQHGSGVKELDLFERADPV